MTDAEKPVFTAALAGMFEMHREGFSDFLAEAYWEGLRQWPLDVVTAVIGDGILDWKYCPKLAELRDLAKARDEHVRALRPALEAGRASRPNDPMGQECLDHTKLMLADKVTPDEHRAWLRTMHKKYRKAGFDDSLAEYDAYQARRQKIDEERRAERTQPEGKYR